MIKKRLYTTSMKKKYKFIYNKERKMPRQAGHKRIYSYF